MAFNISSIDLKDKKTQVAVLIGLLSILAAVIYVSFVLVPQVERVFEAVGQASKLSSDLRDARSDVANIPKFKSDMASYEEKVERYEKMLPAEQEIPAFLESLSGMARSSGIKIGGIMPVITKEDKAKRASVYKEQTILINAKSGFHELGKFLSSMENADRFIKVSDLSIKSSAQSPKKQDVEIMVLTYTLSRGR